MSSIMMHCIGFILSVLVVTMSCQLYNDLYKPELVTYRYYPINFAYETNKDNLHMEITLKNIDPRVTTGVVKLHEGSSSNFSRNLVITGDRTAATKFKNLLLIGHNHTFVNVELYKQAHLCSTVRIANGRATSTLFLNTNLQSGANYYADHKGTYYNDIGTCLAPKPCRILVDAKDLCKGQTPTDVDCKKEASQYICTMSGALRVYKWYQSYDNKYTIGDIPWTNRTKMKLIVKLELFDNNTLVILNTLENGKHKFRPNKLLIKADDKVEDYKATTLKYSEATDIQFSCQEYVQRTSYNPIIMHIGFINTTNNEIKTFYGTSMENLSNMVDNGTILCCLFYITKDVGTGELHIERFVEKKTLLIYQPKSTANLTETKEQTTSNSQNSWLIITTSIGIFILMLLLYVISKKIWCTNPHPAETVELENNAPQNEVLYADLDLVTRANPPRSQNEESDYATIVGALHPL